MPTVELIDPASIPLGMRANSTTLVADATEQLRRALHANQALTVRLAPDERAHSIADAYHRAAADLHVGVVITWTEKRTYAGRNGQERREAGVLYVRITKAVKQETVQRGHRPVVVRPATTVFDPITKCEISR